MTKKTNNMYIDKDEFMNVINNCDVMELYAMFRKCAIVGGDDLTEKEKDIFLRLNLTFNFETNEF